MNTPAGTVLGPQDQVLQWTANALLRLSSVFHGVLRLHLDLGGPSWARCHVGRHDRTTLISTHQTGDYIADEFVHLFALCKRFDAIS